MAVILAKTGAVKELLTATKEVEIIGSFLAGIFFVSIFTAAPATVALAEIAQSNSILLVAVFGGFAQKMFELRPKNTATLSVAIGTLSVPPSPFIKETHLN